MRRTNASIVLCLSLLALAPAASASKSGELHMVFHPVTNNAVADHVLDNGAIASRYHAEELLRALLGANCCGEGTIIHTVRWSAATPPVASSHWYAYNPKGRPADADMSNRRLYGYPSIRVVAVHIDAPAGTPFKYSYRSEGRLPANVQNLVNLIPLFKAQAEKLSAPAVETVWATDTIGDVDRPADVFLKCEATIEGGTIATDATEIKFDNEGFYWWDISIGVPIKSYKQLQGVTGDGGQSLQASVDKKDLLALGNFFFRPVDLKEAKFLAIPHAVAGIALASKPLHAVFVGLGWGPAVANFYVGAMILTENLPGGKKDTDVKFGFGLNVPLRAMGAKLGIKSQAQ